MGKFNFGLGAADSARSVRRGRRVDRFVQLDGARDDHLRPLPERHRRVRDQASTTKGAANDCGGGMGGRAAGGTTGAAARHDGRGRRGTTGGGRQRGRRRMAGSGGASGVATLPWPTTDTVVTVDEMNKFTSNL